MNTRYSESMNSITYTRIPYFVSIIRLKDVVLRRKAVIG